MTNDCRREALAAWYDLLAHPGLLMDVEEQYDELLKAADEMERANLISCAEWRSLVRKAVSVFAHDRSDAGSGAQDQPLPCNAQQPPPQATGNNH